MKVSIVKPAELGPSELSVWRQIQKGDAQFSNPCFMPGFTCAAAKVRSDVEVAILEEAGSVRGFFPFHRVDNKAAVPIGSTLSDMHGIVVEPGFVWEPLDLLQKCRLQGWKFDHLIASQKQFAPFHSSLDDSPYMDLSGGFDAYLAARRSAGSSVVRNAKRKARKLEREFGPVRFELHDDTPGALEKLIEFKTDQLQRRALRICSGTPGSRS